MTIKCGTTFPTLKAAREHFGNLRKRTDVKGRLPEPDRSDVLDVYQRYCAATNWPAQDAVDVTVVWDNRQRPVGSYAQTKAFAVVTASDEVFVFSIDKALAEIAS